MSLTSRLKEAFLNFSKSLKIQKTIILVLLLATVTIWYAVFYHSDQKLHVEFFDVGQGDSIFIQTPGQHQILVDGGPGEAVLSHLGQKMPPWDKEIDLVVLTHPHKDHLEGLVSVLEKYKVDAILEPQSNEESSLYQKWEGEVKKEGAKHFWGKAGEEILVGDVKFNVLYPLSGQNKDTNLNSIIIKLTYGENSVLLTGDAEVGAADEILAGNQDLKSGILKVAHHGSKNGVNDNPQIFAKIAPQIAIISVGENNRYGHPNKETIDLLEKAGVKIMRTDLRGTVSATCNLKECKISTKK